MFKKALVSILLALSLVSPALADNRWIYYDGQNPTAGSLNQVQVNDRIGDSQRTIDFMGGDTTPKYTNLSLVPTGSSFTAKVQPTVSNSYGGLYQYLAVDTTDFGGATDPDRIPANANQVMVLSPVLQSLALGPFTPPGSSGQTIIYLVEAKINVTDTMPAVITFYDSHGTPRTQTLPTFRADSQTYTVKASAAGPAPTPPSVDSGYLGIATIAVPFGTLSGLGTATITPFPPWTGFAYANNVAPLTGVAVTGSTNITGTSTASQFISTTTTLAPFIVNSATSVVGLNTTGNAATATDLAPGSILSLAKGGTGTGTPALAAGNGIALTNPFPNTSIALVSSPAIVGLNLSGLNASQCVRTDGSKNLGSSGLDCITALTAGTNITVGSGVSPTIATVASPSFTSLTETSATVNSCVRTNGAKLFVSATGDCIIGINAGANISVGGTFVSPTIDVVSNPTFAGLTLSGLTAGQCVSTAGGGLLTTTACPTGTPITSVIGTSPIAVAVSSGVATVSISPTPNFDSIALDLTASPGIISSNTTGANDAFQFNALNAVSPTGNLASFQVLGTNVATIDMAGKGTFTNLNDSALAISSAVCTDASKNLTTSGCSGGGGAVSSVTAGSANLVISPTTGAVIADLASSISLAGTTPIALTGTGANTITSASTGLNEAFILNAAGSPTANILDLQFGGVSKLIVDPTGSIQANNVLAVGNVAASTGNVTGTTGIIAGASSTIAFEMQGATSNIIQSDVTGGGTGIVLNTTTGATGNLVDFSLNNVRKAAITNAGGFSGTAVTDSGLTTGRCVQASTSGLLTTPAAFACGNATIGTTKTVFAVERSIAGPLTVSATIPAIVPGTTFTATGEGFQCLTVGAGTSTFQWQTTTSADPTTATWTNIGTSQSFTTAGGATSAITSTSLSTIKWVRANITAAGTTAPQNCFFYLTGTQTIN